jgi:hypothetical protein
MISPSARRGTGGDSSGIYCGEPRVSSCRLREVGKLVHSLGRKVKHIFSPKIQEAFLSPWSPFILTGRTAIKYDNTDSTDQLSDSSYGMLIRSATFMYLFNSRFSSFRSTEPMM